MSNDDQDLQKLWKARLDFYESIDSPGFQAIAAKLRAGGPPPTFRPSAAPPLVLDTDVGGTPTMRSRWHLRPAIVRNWPSSLPPTSETETARDSFDTFLTCSGDRTCRWHQGQILAMSAILWSTA